MRMYKHNLLLKGSRYGDLEQRTLHMLATKKRNEAWIMQELEILLSYLLEDGLLIATENVQMGDSGVVRKLYRLTPKGRKYIANWPTS
jgi:DNA-binding PadR family transcriptional regulator